MVTMIKDALNISDFLWSPLRWWAGRKRSGNHRNLWNNGKI